MFLLDYSIKFSDFYRNKGLPFRGFPGDTLSFPNGDQACHDYERRMPHRPTPPPIPPPPAPPQMVVSDEEMDTGKLLF